MSGSRLGRWSAVAVFLIGLAYLVTLAVGFAARGLAEPIVDPILAIMEVLTLMSAPPMVVIMAAIHDYAPVNRKIYGVIALAFTILFAGSTSAVHFVALTAGRQLGSRGIVWPSAVYAVELLAWNLFLGLALLFAAPVFDGGGPERGVRGGLLISGPLRRRKRRKHECRSKRAEACRRAGPHSDPRGLWGIGREGRVRSPTPPALDAPPRRLRWPRAGPWSHWGLAPTSRSALFASSRRSRRARRETLRSRSIGLFLTIPSSSWSRTVAARSNRSTATSAPTSLPLRRPPCPNRGLSRSRAWPLEPTSRLWATAAQRRRRFPSRSF